MLQLLGRMSSNNVQKVVWLLDELAVPYVQQNYGGTHGGNRTPEYLLRNPHGTVPTIIDGHLVLWESNTILRYIANKHHSAFYPSDIEARAHIDKWMDWQLGTLSPAFRPLYVALVREGKTIAESQDQHQAAARQFALLEKALGNNPYITGTSPTLADIAIGPMLYRWFKLGLDQFGTPKLRSLLDRYAAMPAFANAVSGELA